MSITIKFALLIGILSLMLPSILRHVLMSFLAIPHQSAIHIIIKLFDINYIRAPKHETTAKKTSQNRKSIDYAKFYFIDFPGADV